VRTSLTVPAIFLAAGFGTTMIWPKMSDGTYIQFTHRIEALFDRTQDFDFDPGSSSSADLLPIRPDASAGISGDADTYTPDLNSIVTPIINPFAGSFTRFP
jgi:hypothetical protein